MRLDITDWMQRLLSESVDPSKGFVFEASGIPDDIKGADSYLALASRDSAEDIDQERSPVLTVFYGFAASGLDVLEITNTTALVTWQQAPGADYHVVEVSLDNTNWERLPPTDRDEDHALDGLSPSTSYYVRIASVYEDFSSEAIYTPAVKFTTGASEGSLTVAPAPPTLSIDEDREHVVVTFPDPDPNNPTIDRWEVARGGTSKVVARIHANIAEWRDRYPDGGTEGKPSAISYYVRGRIDAANNKWTAWSSAASITPSFVLRSRLESPNVVLELEETSVFWRSGSFQQFKPAVETSVPWRWPVSAGEFVELDFVFRSEEGLNSGSGQLRYGFHFYDKGGLPVKETSAHYDDIFLNSYPSEYLSLVVEVPPTAAYAAVFFDFAETGGLAQDTRVRIERIEVYRSDEEKDTGWEYVPVADSNGRTPDDRDETVDETIFTYDGVGWTALASPPGGAASTAPYRETDDVEDELTWIVSGSMCELLLYGTTTGAVVEISRLSDDLPVKETEEGEEKVNWATIIDPQFELEFGPEIITNTNAEAGAEGWTALGATEPVANMILANGATLEPSAVSPLVGSKSFLAKFTEEGQGAAYVFPNFLFRAGKTYRVSILVRSVATDFYDFYFGNFTPMFREAGGTLPLSEVWSVKDGVQDRFHELAAGVTETLTFDWTPEADTNTAIFCIRATNSAPSEIRFDSVSCKEVTGVKIPATTDFAAQSIKLPARFSNQFPTPYKIRLLSGKIRPYGVKRDPLNVLEYSADFDTVLQAAGTIRNQTYGELDLVYDEDPPKVYHYRDRGVDHSQIAGGLDLRFGRNVLVNKRVSEPNQVVNRLIFLGYGDDRTQLVTEIRSFKDAQGRVPSDPEYRYDGMGRPPTDPDWDVKTGGTSEEIYGMRYGKYRDSSVQSIHRAKELGTKLVELSAWPLETFQVTAVDVDEVPATIDVGDLVPVRYRGQDKKLRIVSFSTDTSAPRKLELTLGEPMIDVASQIERLAKENEASLSFINATTGAADGTSTSST